MIPRSHLAIWLGLLVASAAAQEAEPLRVRAVVPPGAFYVGQAIELQVAVVAAGERPRIFPPRIEDAEVTPTGTALRPIATSAIGDLVVSEVNAYGSFYRVVPRRAGTLQIPPFVARQGDLSGASNRFRLEVRPLPLAGRPREFLGGVGRFEVETDAQPRVLRVGQELDYQIRLTGPGARGATIRPELASFSRSPLGLRVEPLPIEAVADPPARTFRYRIRPSRAGETALPPVAIAAFDPASARYVTKLAPGVAIRVVDVPRFDPEALDYGGPAVRATHPGGILIAAGALAGIVLAGLGGAILLQRKRRTDPRRWARRWARGLDAEGGAAEAGRKITDGLAVYLSRAAGRPPGVLTPDEARREIEALSGDPDLALRGCRLVAECDRARFSGRGASAAELVNEARDLFVAFGRSPGRGLEREGGGETGKKPGEAPGTTRR